MQQTTNYNLKKPEGTDFYNIGDHNDNSDALDGFLGGLQHQLAAEYAAATTYAKDSYCSKDKKFYRCKADGTTGAWDASKWDEVKAGTELAQLKEEKADKTELKKLDDAFKGIGGNFLGTSYTAEQQAEVSAGTFKNLQIGDYWTIGDHNWRIWDIDWYLNKGDTACTTHHLVIMPDDNLLDADGSTTRYMKDTDDTSGAYASTKYRSTYRSGCKTTIESCFGSGKVLSHRELIANATSGGAASGWDWYDADVEIPSEVMMYGSNVWSNGAYNTGTAYPKLALARLKPSAVVNRENYWLRDVASASWFAHVASAGSAYALGASAPWFGVRPYFLLK